MTTLERLLRRSAIAAVLLLAGCDDGPAPPRRSRLERLDRELVRCTSDDACPAGAGCELGACTYECAADTDCTGGTCDDHGRCTAALGDPP